MDTPTVQIPSGGYTAGTVNLGADYAAGMQAGSKVGEQIGQGITEAANIMNRNQTANDMLGAMHQMGILSDKQYSSIAGKSLGAKEQMTGMFANQWVLDQANQRALALSRGQGGIDVATQHAKYLDMYNLYRQGQLVSDPKKMPWQATVPQQTPVQQTPVGATNVAPSQNAVLAAQQTAGQYAGGPVRGAPPAQTTPRAFQLPGTRYVQRTDPATGKIQTGTLYPSGQFIPD